MGMASPMMVISMLAVKVAWNYTKRRVRLRSPKRRRLTQHEEFRRMVVTM